MVILIVYIIIILYLFSFVCVIYAVQFARTFLWYKEITARTGAIHTHKVMVRAVSLFKAVTYATNIVPSRNGLECLIAQAASLTGAQTGPACASPTK